MKKNATTAVASWLRDPQRGRKGRLSAADSCLRWKSWTQNDCVRTGAQRHHGNLLNADCLVLPMCSWDCTSTALLENRLLENKQRRKTLHAVVSHSQTGTGMLRDFACSLHFNTSQLLIDCFILSVHIEVMLDRCWSLCLLSSLQTPQMLITLPALQTRQLLIDVLFCLFTSRWC